MKAININKNIAIIAEHETIEHIKIFVKKSLFINTVLGETWVERGEAPEYKNIQNRAEDYQTNIVPDDVCFLTCGVDVQKDRIECEVVGWCSDKRSYSIDYRVFEGDTVQVTTWDKLANILEERWKRRKSTTNKKTPQI